MGDVKQKLSTAVNKLITENEEILYYDKTYPKQLLQGLRQLKNVREFCDIILIVNQHEFFCHKVILAASSSYFNIMFTCNLSESSKNTIEIKGIDVNIFTALIDYAYSSEIIINKSNVQNLLSASNLLQFLSIRDACCNFLKKHIDETNCIGIHCFAESHNCIDLQNNAKLEILSHFLKVIKHDEYLALESKKLVEIIADDDINISREEELFDALLIWLEHDYFSRKSEFHILLSQVRLVFMDAYFIHDKLESSPVITEDLKCQQIVNQAKTYQLLEHHRYFPILNTKPRKAFGLSEIVITTGGEDDKVVLRGMESYDPIINEWKTFSCLPFAISKHGLVTSGRYLYMAGGEFPDGITNSGLWRYEFFIDVWQELPAMNMARTELGLAYLDGYVYAIGGWDSTNRLSSLERYDPHNALWQQMLPMPEPLSSPAVVTHRGLLYVLGGAKSKGNSCSSYFYMYDPKVNKWTNLPDMPVPKFASSASILNDKIYLIGGYTSLNNISNTVECFDILKNEWVTSIVSDMKEKRARAGVASACGKIYMFGGEENWEKYHDSIEEYDEAMNDWKIIGNIPSPRGGLTCVTLQIKRDHYEKFKSIHIE